MAPAWPLYQADAIVVANPDSDVAVLTLWTDARRVAAALDPATFAACGNLYSAAGVAYLARNLLANPRIRYLVLCGVDLTGTAMAIRALFQAQGAEAESARAARLSASELDALRQGVRLVDLAGVADPTRIAAEIAALPRLPP